MESKDILVPPNGSYGWVVVFAAQLINIFHQSLISVFGLLFGQLFNFALHMSKKDIALIMNITNLFLNLSGLFTTILIKTFSPRKVTIVACISVSVGLIFTSFTTSMLQIMFSYCILVGIGLGFATNSVMVIVTSYFTTKKSMAVSFSMAGSGLGKMLMPQVVGFLLLFYDFRGVILIVGALTLHGLIGALLLQPLSWHMKRKNFDDETAPLICDKNKKNDEKASDENMSFWQQIFHKMDLNLLKDFHFLIINLVLACDNAVTVDFTLIFPFFLEESIGLSKYQIALCLTVYAAFDLASRLSFHFITDKFKIANKTVYVFGIITAGIFRAFLAEARTFNMILIFIAIFGYLRATSVVNQVLILSDHCAKNYPEKFSGAYGLNMIIKGIVVMIVGQILGHLRDTLIGYEMCFHIHNAFLAIVLLIWLLESNCLRKIQ